MDLPHIYPTLIKSEIINPAALVRSYARHHPEIPVFPEPGPFQARAPKDKKVLTGMKCPRPTRALHTIPLEGVPCDVPEPQ